MTFCYPERPLKPIRDEIRVIKKSVAKERRVQNVHYGACED